MAYAKKIDNYGDTNWYLVDRKPYRCPSCNSRKIGKAILGYPSEEDFYDESLFIIGCNQIQLLFNASLVAESAIVSFGKILQR